MQSVRSHSRKGKENVAGVVYTCAYARLSLSLSLYDGGARNNDGSPWAGRAIVRLISDTSMRGSAGWKAASARIAAVAAIATSLGLRRATMVSDGGLCH